MSTELVLSLWKKDPKILRLWQVQLLQCDKGLCVVPLHRDGGDGFMDKMSTPLSRTRKCLSRNTSKPERSKIGETCLVSWECVNETRARQKSRSARALD